MVQGLVQSWALYLVAGLWLVRFWVLYLTAELWALAVVGALVALCFCAFGIIDERRRTRGGR